MSQTVYVLMSFEGSGKNKGWRPVAVVSNSKVAEQWTEYGKDVDWVPLELDDITEISPERMPKFQPRDASPGEERATELQEKLKAMVQRMEKIIKEQDKVIKSLQKTGAAESTPPKPEGFSETLDAQGLADYIEAYAPYEVDNEFVYEKFRGTHTVLRLVPIAELREGDRDHNLQSKENEDEYLEQDLGTQPPAVVENGEVVDGNHRLRANKRKGLTSMWCYVVEEGD